MSSVRQESVNGIKWSAIEKFATQGIQFFLGLILARLLAPSDYGVIGMYGIFLAVSQTFVDSGFSSALIKKQDRTEDDFCTAFYFNIVIAIVCYAVLFVIAPWVGRFFHTPILCPILRVQAVTLIINSLMGVQVTKLTIDIDFKALANRSILATIISGVMGIILAYNGWGVWALVAQGIVSSLVNLFFIWIYCRWMPRRGFSKKSFHEMFSYGSKLLASGLINTVYSKLTTLIIGRFFTAKDLGVYERGISFPSIPVYNINGALQRVLFPILSRYQNDHEQLISYYRKYIGFVSMTLFFICTLIAAIGQPLVIFLLTDKWAECIVYLQIFCFSIMFDHLCIINHTLLLAIGRSDLFLKLELIKKPVFLAILLTSIPFGVLGICISKILTTQIAVIMNCYYTGKIFNYGFLKQMKDYMPFFFMSIIACLPAYLFTQMNLYPFISLLVGCVTAPMIYWLLLRRHPYMVEATSMASQKIKSWKGENTII